MKVLKKKLKSLPDKALDAMFLRHHEEVFKQTDCLDCGNCCKTLGPRLTKTDIRRMAKYLKVKEGDFFASYLRVDEDGDTIMKALPCPFLGGDNYCSVYPARPKACREYPHTDHTKMKKHLNLLEKNLKTCPAAQQIVDRITKDLGLPF